MNDGISLIDGILGIMICLVIANLIFAVVKVNSEFELNYDNNIDKIESDVNIIYEQKGLYIQ